MKIRTIVLAMTISLLGALLVSPASAFAATDPCQGSPSPGTVCADGTVYAGLTPDGNVPMATTTTDVNSTNYSLSLISWNNGGSNYAVSGLNNAVTGQANTAALNASQDAGSPYKAAQACVDLSSNGHNDWYLPAADELSVLIQNAAAIGNFLSGYTYWSSTEEAQNNIAADYAVQQADSSGSASSGGLKSYANRVRCVRKITTGTGTTYYVSPSGNDSNSGTSQNSAWQTVAKVNLSSFNGGDSVLFQGGQTFTGCLSFSSSNVNGAPGSTFTVGSYGSGEFTLKSNCSGTRSAAVLVNAVNGFILENAILTPASGNATQFGVWLENTTASYSVSGMAVENCDISGFTTTLTTDTAAEIFITGYPGNGLNNVQITGNKLHGANGVTSTDDDGVTGYGDNENLTNVLYQFNTVYNIGGRAGVSDTGNGIIANGVNDGIMQHNVAHDLGANANTCGGDAGIWTYSSNNITIQYNEVYNVRPSHYTAGCDWDGFDLDGHVTNSTVQYNYSHDNYGAGYLSYGTTDSSNKTFRYNISENDDQIQSTSYFGCFAMNNNSGSVNFYNNTCYLTPGGIGIGFGGGYPSSGVIANNIFYVPASSDGNSIFIGTSGFTGTPTVTLSNNDYYGTGNFLIQDWGGTNYTSLATFQSKTGEDSGSRTVNPQLDNPGSGGTCNGYSTTCPSAYELSGSSPMIGTGLNLQNTFQIYGSPQDYYGNSIPNGVGTGYNLGAYGGTQ